jgi:hypothetical protein
MENGVLHGDVIVMYFIAGLLDLAGLIAFIIGLVWFLAPLAIMIQFAISIAGFFIFTIWIVLFRGGSIKGAIKRGAGAVSKSMAKVASKESGSNSGDKDGSEEEVAISGKGGGLLKKFLMRVLLVFGIEIIPYVGKISPTWIIAVHLESKND